VSSRRAAPDVNVLQAYGLKKGILNLIIFVDSFTQYRKIRQKQIDFVNSNYGKLSALGSKSFCSDQKCRK
jgi:hypothetical protein